MSNGVKPKLTTNLLLHDNAQAIWIMVRQVCSARLLEDWRFAFATMTLLLLVKIQRSALPPITDELFVEVGMEFLREFPSIGLE